MSQLVVVFISILCFTFLFRESCGNYHEEESEEFSFSAAWENFWSISCEFSNVVVTRSKRSTKPNLANPEELFDYLYPLADVKLEDYLADEKRSTHSMSTWIEDLIGLWEEECHSRHHRNKRAATERNVDGYPTAEEIDPEEDENLFPINDMIKADNSSATTSTTSAPPTKAKEKKVIADGDTFFAQYGGDIEYFFPLLSFGVPFDGEITFLGFHGFKGLFPYK